MLQKDDTECLRQRIICLEEKIVNLRIGRRVLMNIIEQNEKTKNDEIEQLKKEIQRLRKSNKKYAELLSAKTTVDK